MWKDAGILLLAGLMVYEVLTGKVSMRVGYVTREKNPIAFWIWAPFSVCFAALLIMIAFYDLYRRLSK